MSVTTIDCDYLGEGFAAAYLMREGDRAAFVETNTTHAVPKLLAALEAEGLQPEAVDWVIITHVHLDHAGGASALMEACPNATLLAHPRAARHAIDPSKLVASAQQVYGEETFASLYGEIRPIDEARVRTMDDGETLRWGARTLTFLHTRGHANHHFCVLDSKTNAIFTGDAFGLVYPRLQHHGLFAIPSTSPTDFDAPAAKASLDRIVATGADRAYLTHFGGHEQLEGIAGQLHRQLDVYGGIVAQALADEIDEDALDAFCEARVRALFDQLLETHGLADDGGAREILKTDMELNAQGVAFAVKKARHKLAQKEGTR
ncbi:MAG: MBL fold metallo-hydrolase [Myxococcota bacterium]|nr:MBL fold metallo-hydrolase [Myxococcota bacterium]